MIFIDQWTCVQCQRHHDAGMKLGELTNDALVSRMAVFCRLEQTLLAHVLAGIIEIEKRELHLELASSSLYDFCVNRLGMSEGTAFRRIAAARLVKDFPCLLKRVANGGLHLSSLLLLRGYLTEANAEKLAADASGLPESKLKELLAARFPRPPVPERIDPLATQGMLGDAATPANAPRSSTEPLSPTTYLARLTISSATHAKLLRARDMLMHREHSADLATVVDRALDVLLDKLERERLGKADRPRASRVGDADVSRSTRREVVARDGEQCTYRSKSGDRCTARALLEFDHGHARALGGAHGPDNVRILCAAHNQFRAKKDFGSGYVARMVAHSRATSAARKRQRTTGTTAAVCGIERHGPVATDAGAREEGPGYDSVVPWGMGRRGLAPGSVRHGLCGTVVPWSIERDASSVEAPGSAVEGGGGTACTSIDEGRRDRVPAMDAGIEDVDTAAPTSIDEGGRDRARAASSDEGPRRSPAPVSFDAGERCGSTDSGGGPGHEGRAVYGLVSLGFERKASLDTVRTLLGRGDGAPSLVELMREAIGILANARPSSSGSRRGRGRMADAR